MFLPTFFNSVPMNHFLLQVVQAPDAFSNLLDEEFRSVPLTSLIPIHDDDEDKTEDRAPPTPESDDPNVSSVSASEETAIAVALDHYRFGSHFGWLQNFELDVVSFDFYT